MEVSIYSIVSIYAILTTEITIDLEFNGVLSARTPNMHITLKSVLESVERSKPFLTYHKNTVKGYYGDSHTIRKAVVLMETISVDTEEELYKYVFNTYTTDYLKGFIQRCIYESRYLFS